MLLRMQSKTSRLIIALITVVALIMSLLLTACDDSQSEDGQTTQISSSSAPEETEAQVSEMFDESEALSVLTVDNSAELSGTLNAADPYDNSVLAFFKNNMGKTIEFDGNIASCANHGSMKTRFDYLVHAGDYSLTSARGPEMQFYDVSYSDLNTDLDSVPAGINVRIVAEIEEVNDASGLVLLNPISVTGR